MTVGAAVVADTVAAAWKREEVVPPGVRWKGMNAEPLLLGE